MPTIDHKLASQRLQVQGGNRGLNPVLFDTSAAGRIRAPQIDPNAANVQFTPVQPGRVGIKTPLEATAEGASKLMEVWGNAATQYADRQNELDAMQALQAIERNHQTVLYGTDETPGYLQAGATEARDKFKSTFDALDKQDQQILMSLPPNARAKAALKYYSIRDQTRQKAIEYRHSQDIELKKRKYQWDADNNAQTITRSIIQNFNDLPYLDAESQAELIKPILEAMQGEAIRRGSKVDYAPMGTNVHSSVFEDVMRDLLTSPDPNALDLAETLWPHFDKYMDDPSGREKVHRLMYETYSKQNAKVKAQLEGEKLREEVQTQEIEDTLRTEVVARLYDPQKMMELKQLHMANSAATDIITQTENLFKENLPLDPAREQLLLDLKYREVSPIQAMKEMQKAGQSWTRKEYQEIVQNYNLKTGELVKTYTASLTDELKGMLQDKKKIDEEQGQALTMVLDDAQSTPPGQALLARLNRQISDYIINLVSSSGGKVGVPELRQKISTFMDTVILDEAVTGLDALRSSGATASTVPKHIRISLIANKEPDVPVIDQSKTVVEGLWQLRSYMYDIYGDDPKRLPQLQKLMGRDVTFDQFSDFYENAITTKNTKLLEQLNKLFKEMYIKAQEHVARQQGVDNATFKSYSSEALREANRLTSRYREDQVIKPVKPAGDK